MRCERGKSQDSQLDNERVIPPPLVTGYKEEGRDTSQVQVKALGAVLSGLSTLYKSCSAYPSHLCGYRVSILALV